MMPASHRRFRPCRPGGSAAPARPARPMSDRRMAGFENNHLLEFHAARRAVSVGKHPLVLQCEAAHLTGCGG